MPLPLLCPKSKNSACSGDACPMYTIDWRSKDEYCMIGYYPAGSRKKLGESVVDTYARGINKGKTAHARSKNDRILQEDELPETSVLDSQAKSQAEEVTDLISEQKIEKKHKSRDFINLKDIPDNYEEEFWS